MATDFGLSVLWDGHHNAKVECPVHLWNSTCGLCGSFDGNPANDFLTPDGQLVS